MICPKCQIKLQDGEAVCPTCGLCRTDMPIVQANPPTPKKKTGVLLTILAFLSPLALTEGVMAAILDIGRRVVIALRTDAFGSGNFELGNTLGIAGTILSQVTHFVFFLAVGLTVPSLILSIIAKAKKKNGAIWPLVGSIIAAAICGIMGSVYFFETIRFLVDGFMYGFI